MAIGLNGAWDTLGRKILKHPLSTNALRNSCVKHIGFKALEVLEFSDT